MSGVRHIHNLTIHLNLNDKTLQLEFEAQPCACWATTYCTTVWAANWMTRCLSHISMFYSCIYSCMMVLVGPCRLLPKSVDTHLSLTKSPMLFSETS